MAKPTSTEFRRLVADAAGHFQAGRWADAEGAYRAALVLAPDEAGQVRAHLRTVRSGAMLGDEVLVLEGLTPGETVAASGSFKLREGVLVVSPQATPGAAVSGK